jgi:hypothetical protein
MALINRFTGARCAVRSPFERTPRCAEVPCNELLAHRPDLPSFAWALCNRLITPKAKTSVPQFIAHFECPDTALSPAYSE